MPLLVLTEFAGHARGDLISDPAVVQAILDGPHAHFVTPISADAAAPEPAQASLPDIIED